MKVKMKVKSLSRDPMDCSPPGSSAHGILQARVLEWGAIAFSATKTIEALTGTRGGVRERVRGEKGRMGREKGRALRRAGTQVYL